MNQKFLNMIDSAAEQKRSFETSVAGIQKHLERDVFEAKHFQKDAFSRAHFDELNKTGWLKGSLSYPWVVLFIFIPTIIDLFH